MSNDPVEELARKAALFGERYGHRGRLGDVKPISEAEAQEILTRFNEVWATLPNMPVLAVSETRKVIPGYVWVTNAGSYNTYHLVGIDPCNCAVCIAERHPTWIVEQEAVGRHGQPLPGIVAFYKPEGEAVPSREAGSYPSSWRP